MTAINFSNKTKCVLIIAPIAFNVFLAIPENKKLHPREPQVIQQRLLIFFRRRLPPPLPFPAYIYTLLSLLSLLSPLINRFPILTCIFAKYRNKTKLKKASICMFTCFVRFCTGIIWVFPSKAAKISGQ